MGSVFGMLGMGLILGCLLGLCMVTAKMERAIHSGAITTADGTFRITRVEGPASLCWLNPRGNGK